MKDFSFLQEQAYEYLEKGIELCRKIGSDYLLSLYHCHMALCVSRFNYEDALKIYDDYFAVDNSIKNGTRNTDLDIVAFAALSLYKLNRYFMGRCSNWNHRNGSGMKYSKAKKDLSRSNIV